MTHSRRAEPLLGFLVLAALWLIAVDVFRLVDPLLLPPLCDVILRLVELITNGSLTRDIAATLARWIQGFGLGIFLGTSLGLLLGIMPRIYRIVGGPLDFFRGIPVTAIFPLFLMIFGIGDASKIAMAFLPTFLLMIINASYGVIHTSPERRRALQIFGANRIQVFYHVVFFEALPQIFIGVRLSVSLSLMVTVVSEMFIGTDTGLGQRIYDSYLTSSVSTLYAYLLVLGLIGYGLNKASVYLEKRTIFWAGRA